MATAAAAAVAKARRDLISHFMSRDAVSADRAVPYRPERRVQRSMFRRLCDAGVLKPGNGGGYWIDIPAWDAYARRRRRRIGVIVAASLAAALAVVCGLAALLA